LQDLPEVELPEPERHGRPAQKPRAPGDGTPWVQVPLTAGRCEGCDDEPGIYRAAQADTTRGVTYTWLSCAGCLERVFGAHFDATRMRYIQGEPQGPLYPDSHAQQHVDAAGAIDTSVFQDPPPGPPCDRCGRRCEGSGWVHLADDGERHRLCTTCDLRQRLLKVADRVEAFELVAKRAELRSTAAITALVGMRQLIEDSLLGDSPPACCLHIIGRMLVRVLDDAAQQVPR
jgi:hypothetical protein